LFDVALSGQRHPPAGPAPYRCRIESGESPLIQPDAGSWRVIDMGTRLAENLLLNNEAGEGRHE
jgi:hypothetical protein